jgi:hypothetical protein
MGTGKSSALEPETSGSVVEQNDTGRYKLDLRHRLKQTDNRVDTFFAVQEWEGHVVSKTAEAFTARLLDITAGANKESEEVDLPLSDISPVERETLKEGAIFRWTIGYEISKRGQRKRTSQIVFRQLPRWTHDELNSALKKGEDRAARIHSE